MGGTRASDEPLTRAEAAGERTLLLAQVVVALTSAVAAASLVSLFPGQSDRLVAWAVASAKFSVALHKTFGDGTAARIAAWLPWACAGLIGGAFAWRRRELVRRFRDRLFPPLDTDVNRPFNRGHLSIGFCVNRGRSLGVVQLPLTGPPGRAVQARYRAVQLSRCPSARPASCPASPDRR